jgi:hypothetical protein
MYLCILLVLEYMIPLRVVGISRYQAIVSVCYQRV